MVTGDMLTVMSLLPWLKALTCSYYGLLSLVERRTRQALYYYE
jgi:hypothetical protein